MSQVYQQTSGNEVTVVDHGLCNMFNISCALEEVGARVIVARNADQIAQATRLILPGVGAFEPAMQTLRDMGLVEAIQAHAASGKPLLGICLGMQLLMAYSEENGRHQGLGLVKGGALRFPAAVPGGPVYKVPQIAWNTLHHNPALESGWNDPLLDGVPEGAPVYFVHSYYVATEDPADALACSVYGGTAYASMVRHANIWGAQFHPERSAKHGLKMLANFVRLPGLIEQGKKS